MAMVFAGVEIRARRLSLFVRVEPTILPRASEILGVGGEVFGHLVQVALVFLEGGFGVGEIEGHAFAGFGFVHWFGIRERIEELVGCPGRDWKA